MERVCCCFEEDHHGSREVVLPPRARGIDSKTSNGRGACGILRSVSWESVEIVRRIWEAVERRDTEAVFALYDPAIVLDNSTVPGPLAGVYDGHDGVWQYSQEWRESFETESYRVHAETFIDAGERVVIGVRLTGRGKTSGAEVEMSRWNVYEIRDGLVIRIDIFESEAHALQAAGLEA
jgi:ketosteroid isomerase-like protein